MFRLSRRKAFVIKHDLGAGSLLHKIEPHDRIVARSPALRPPRLYDTLIGDQLEMTPRDASAEQRKRAAHFAADLCGFSADCHRFHGRTETYDVIELLGIRQRFLSSSCLEKSIQLDFVAALTKYLLK